MKKIILSVVIIFSTIAVFIAMVYFDTPKEPVGWVEYVVCNGDTVCDISKSITSENRDYRETEYYIIKKNNIEKALIHPGQTILVPVYE